MEYGFAKLSPKRIVAGTENCGSKRVIGKLGMRHERDMKLHEIRVMTSVRSGRLSTGGRAFFGKGGDHSDSVRVSRFYLSGVVSQ